MPSSWFLTIGRVVSSPTGSDLSIERETGSALGDISAARPNECTMTSESPAPWTPVMDGPMQRIRTAVNARPMVNYDLLASNGVSRHDLAVTALGRVRGRSTVTGVLAVAYRTIVIGCARRSAAPILPRPRNESGSCERP